MAKRNSEFKYKHFEGAVILWAVRWYGQFAISYRDLVIMAAERGLNVSHTTPMRWVHEYAPKMAKKIKPHLKRSNDSYRIDETYSAPIRFWCKLTLIALYMIMFGLWFVIKNGKTQQRVQI